MSRAVVVRSRGQAQDAIFQAGLRAGLKVPRIEVRKVVAKLETDGRVECAFPPRYGNYPEFLYLRMALKYRR